MSEGLEQKGGLKYKAKIAESDSSDKDEPRKSGIANMAPKLVMKALPIEVGGVGLVNIGDNKVDNKDKVERDYSVIDQQDLVSKLGLFMFRDAELLKNELAIGGKVGGGESAELNKELGGLTAEEKKEKIAVESNRAFNIKSFDISCISALKIKLMIQKMTKNDNMKKMMKDLGERFDLY